MASPSLGICRDPANSVAALEHPADTVDRTAAPRRNIHVKDFAFTRKDGWVGFSLAGCPLGEGLLDYQNMIDTVRPGAGVNGDHTVRYSENSPAGRQRTWTRADRSPTPTSQMLHLDTIKR